MVASLYLDLREALSLDLRELSLSPFARLSLEALETLDYLKI
jgi:hypothetical protein